MDALLAIEAEEGDGMYGEDVPPIADVMRNGLHDDPTDPPLEAVMDADIMDMQLLIDLGRKKRGGPEPQGPQCLVEHAKRMRTLKELKGKTADVERLNAEAEQKSVALAIVGVLQCSSKQRVDIGIKATQLTPAQKGLCDYELARKSSQSISKEQTTKHHEAAAKVFKSLDKFMRTNITALFDADTEHIAKHYDFAPFGLRGRSFRRRRYHGFCLQWDETSQKQRRPRWGK